MGMHVRVLWSGTRTSLGMQNGPAFLAGNTKHGGCYSAHVCIRYLDRQDIACSAEVFSE